MVRDITNEEIKDSIFGIGNAKAPGPDGYTSMFFKKSWDIVGGDVCRAVKEFFKSNMLLGEESEKHRILEVMPFSVGTLPMKYMGVPLITKNIGDPEFNQLVERVKQKVKWVNTVKLKDKSIWEVDIEDSDSGTWKSILNLRKGENDCIIWKDNSGKSMKFSIRSVWEKFKDFKSEVSWYKVIWYPQCNPRHAFIAWLAMHRRLATQDRIMVWCKTSNLLCPLCKKENDSHEHLFFKCTYSEDIWSNAKDKVGRRNWSNEWVKVASTIVKEGCNSRIKSVLDRMVFATVIYFIWNERNKRIFTQEQKNAQDILNGIVESIKMQLMCLKVRSSSAVKEISKEWNIRDDMSLIWKMVLIRPLQVLEPCILEFSSVRVLMFLLSSSEWPWEGLRNVARMEEPLMQVNSWGLSAELKQLWLKDSIRDKLLDFVGIQETNSIIWNSSKFTKISSLIGTHFSGVIETFLGISDQVILLNVYGPQSSARKEALWSEIYDLNARYNGIWIIFGDFNVVRSRDERSGSIFKERDAFSFNDFISKAGLCDIHHGGRRYTYFNKKGTKMSKLDRFLISPNFFDHWPNASVTALEHIISDHCPIFLCDKSINFGPKPFKFFDAWLDHPEFPHLVRQSRLADSGGLSGDVILKNKLKRLKSDIKLWADKIRNEASQRIVDLKAKLMEWDSKAELGLICDEDIHVREADVFELLRLNQYEQSLMKQKSRIKWAVKGDKNCNTPK
ncbi:cytochrome P450 [Tanacetum coccineum]